MQMENEVNEELERREINRVRYEEWCNNEQKRIK